MSEIFEKRELPPYAEPLSADERETGTVYFFVSYVDDDTLIPTLETVVFIGRDINAGDVGKVYFQDIHSYREGMDFDSADEEHPVTLHFGSENETGHVFTFPKALEELMKCSVRRRKALGET